MKRTCLRNARVPSRLACVCLLSLVLVLGGVPAAAADIQDVPYHSYTYDGHSSPLKNKAAYVPSRVITGYSLGIGDMQVPKSVFYSTAAQQDGRIYILDSGNSRVIILNRDYSLHKVLDAIMLAGEPQSFDKAEDIFISPEGLLYISDTGNGRVLICREDGTVERVLGVPDSDLIPEGFDFKPICAVKDRKGFTYVLSQGSYYGAIVYDEKETFIGFFGANKVNKDILAVLGQVFDKLFLNDELKSKGVQNLPFQFTNLCLGPDDFLYSLTSSSDSGTGQVRKLNPGGENILVYRDMFDTKSADTFDFSDRRLYEDRQRRTWHSTFADIAVDELGFIYVLDAAYGKVFIYDGACNPISIFGGGAGRGNQMGTFESAVSLTYAHGDILVVDDIRNSVTVFEPTAYYETIRQADSLYLRGDYQKALPLWEEVHSQDKNFQLAYSGIAQGNLMNGQNETAMEYARYASSRTIYAQAFLKVRNQFISANFAWILPACILLIAGMLLLFIYTSKRDVVLIKNGKLRTMMTTITHPINTFNDIQFQHKGSLGLSCLLMAVFSLLSIVAIINGGFMFTDYQPAQYNALFTVLGTAGLILLWSVVNWSVCALLQGNGRLKEIFTVTCYAIIPQILYLLLFLILSHVLVPDEGVFLSALHTICNLWTVVLILFGMMVVHEYDFTKSAATALLTLLGMALAAFIILMIGTLFQEFIDFIKTVVMEIALRKNA